MIGMMIVSGHLFKKTSENPFAIKAFEPLWGKRKAPAFVSKAGTYYGASSVIGLGRKANKTNGFKTSKSSIYFKIIIKNELQNNALHAKWRAFFYFTEVNQHE